MNTLPCLAAVPIPPAPSSTPVRPPAPVFLPGVIAFDDCLRREATIDAVRVQQTLCLAPDGERVVGFLPC